MRHTSKLEIKFERPDGTRYVAELADQRRVRIAVRDGEGTQTIAASCLTCGDVHAPSGHRVVA